ncbi:MAG: hypothetical protein JWO49_1747 [Arthrobacter sp.]|nr:hypothetical protein [Arthrobacter sp.]
MKNSPHGQPRKHTVTLVRWSQKPGEVFINFLIFSIFGLILSLLLMIFIPGLRSLGAVALFTGVFAAILTVPTVSSQRKFMRGLTKRVNDTILEVTSAPGDQLSVKQFRKMVKSGQQLSLLVNGVPGLNLHVERASPAKTHPPGKWLVVFTVIPPENGTASFDRLLAAAIDAGPDTTRVDVA